MAPSMNSRRPTGHGRVCFTSKCQPSNVAMNNSPPLTFCESVAAVLEYNYPLKLMIPAYASSSHCRWLYPVTFGGGLVEGDQFELSIEVKDDCCAMVTTQSSTKVFHCQCGDISSQQMTYTVGRQSLLAVLPDPIVPYAQARYKQTQVIHMTPDSNVVLLDWMTAGRIARGETWDFTSYKTSNRVLLGKEEVFRDAFHLHDSPNLPMKTASGTYQTFGSILILGPALEEFHKALVTSLGQQKPYDSVYGCDKFLSVSPLHYVTDEGELSGCFIRILAKSTREAFSSVEEVLQPLYPVLGGNPFENKY